jgi:hypothetical protein
MELNASASSAAPPAASQRQSTSFIQSAKRTKAPPMIQTLCMRGSSRAL